MKGHDRGQVDKPMQSEFWHVPVKEIACKLKYQLEEMYGVSFDLSGVEQGELRHDRCMSLLLADHTQNIGATKPNAKTRVYRLCT